MRSISAIDVLLRFFLKGVVQLFCRLKVVFGGRRAP